MVIQLYLMVVPATFKFFLEAFEELLDYWYVMLAFLKDMLAFRYGYLAVWQDML